MSSNTQLIQSIQSCVLSHHQSVTVALSGGVDSIVMLHACLAIREQNPSSLTINAIHIHHGLSANADAWLAFCQQLCAQHNVAFLYKKVSVQPAARKSLEALARQARYAAIDALVEANSLVLLAQHEDDQAETVLLQLKRGAGPKGLSGMAQAFKKSSHVEYARPWINAGIGKQDIVAYAQQHKLEWVEDESNNDTAFERNFIRKNVMPLLKKKWPQISSTISRSAMFCASQNKLVEQFALEALQKNQNAEGALSSSGLLALPDALVAEVLRLWSGNTIGFNVSAAQLHEIKKLIAAKEDQVGCVQVADWQCRSFNQYLYWLPTADVIDVPPVAIELNINFDDSSSKFHITYGDLHRKVKLFANRPTKTLKAWMKEMKIKPWRRLGAPIVCLNEQIIGVQFNDDLVISEAFQHQSANMSASAPASACAIATHSFTPNEMSKIISTLHDTIKKIDNSGNSLPLI